jgi:hypothetical protein
MRITNSRPTAPQPTAQKPEADIEADFWRELQAIEATNNREMAEIEAESMGWTELAPGTYLHTANEQATVIDIVGIATSSMAADNVVWLV